MRKGFLFGLILVLLLTFPIANVFAADQTKPIDVFLDGKIISFSVNPLLDNGSTLAQFKPVFETLGLTINWNAATKTVKGTSKDLNIELSIGNKTVIVNGVKKQLTVAPKIINGVTMVPIRFLGEASGRDVSWDGRKRTVYVATTAEQVIYTTALNNAYINAEDVEGALSTYDPIVIDLEQTKVNFESNNTTYDLNYELENVEIITLEKATASVKVTLKTTKIAGPTFEDNRTYMLMNLNKVNGEWKIADSKDLKIDYLKEDFKKEEAVTTSSDNQKLILAVIEKNRDMSVKWDVAGLKSTYDASFPNLDQAMIDFQQGAPANEFEVNYSNIKIIKGSDGEAKVYYMAHIHKKNGLDFPDMNADSVVTLKKSNEGEWKITNEDNLTIEYL
ncbi:copper amine oxidase N-terminal domain-containing protein [Paenibacillus psychroresistens]|nr:copper amine oxidase N-terminal domain-containing protein [Paenibacillus psychroresistens]